MNLKNLFLRANYKEIIRLGKEHAATLSADERVFFLAALAFLGGIRRQPPPEAERGVAEGMARELARWRAMFP